VDTLSVLRKAAVTRNVPTGDVQALLTSLSPEIAYKEGQGSVGGRWELVYSTMIKAYMPVKELIDFKAFSIETSFGPIPLGGIRGLSSVVSTNPVTIRYVAAARSQHVLKNPLADL
jgi:hypothetical protein